jgi:hypothetical protein
MGKDKKQETALHITEDKRQNFILPKLPPATFSIRERLNEKIFYHFDVILSPRI